MAYHGYPSAGNGLGATGDTPSCPSMRFENPRNIAHGLALDRRKFLSATECAMAAKDKDKDLNDLFLDTMKDMYFAEKQILKALPKMAKAANSDKLRAAFEKHQGETEAQVERLEKVFELIDKPARGKTCEAIQGILDEGKEIMDEYKGCEALDAGMLAAAQAVEHYEISRYGTLKQWAQQLGMKEAVRLLDQTLQEEKKTDEALSSIAEAAVNVAAAA
jgi:ferritin-like metal-binding protein YciE